MSSAVDKMNHVVQMLDEYETSLGLPEYADKVSEDIGQYLHMSRDQLEHLTYEDCVVIVAQLMALSFHIQRSLNRETARVKWATSEIRKAISGKEQQYKGSWESQFYQAAMENDYTRKVLDIKNYAEQRVERLHFLSNSINNIAESIRNIQFSRKAK